jgi:hypothetical protein
MLSGDGTVVQASALNRLSFDPFPLQENGLATLDVDVGRGQVCDALVVSQIGDVGLSQLVRRRHHVFELIGSLHDDEGRARDQIVRLEQAINRSLRHKVLLHIGDPRRRQTFSVPSLWLARRRRSLRCPPDRPGYLPPYPSRRPGNGSSSPRNPAFTQ